MRMEPVALFGESFAGRFMLKLDSAEFMPYGKQITHRVRTGPWKVGAERVPSYTLGPLTQLEGNSLSVSLSICLSVYLSLSLQ